MVGTALGLPLRRVTLASDRSVRMGGEVSFSGHGEAQLFAVWLAAGSLGQTRCLRAAGYLHPELHRCVRDFAGGGDRAAAERLTADGFTIDLQRARADASRLLGDPGLWAAVEQTARLLLTQRQVAPRDVAAALVTHRVSARQVWTPDLGSADG